ncbi:MULTISPECIES: HypC/HybG/HupF family hydrogenase formation chaperone [unclassified Streptomyces]|uniref:HypC/HybG/HupF family hydrogenase formation chaperone n=1 Tax=unclassified Streptomyces TaxID=2593676 RepID=UPI002DDC6AF4|nr:HypC/HybG/HupF family hydrogenase formation chaperone [Streptomyces sp. NBC_01750]WSB03673.1 HypC/HybG/HupF family hydrogenase formation chaperone [Streptomyces sp. NBC_01794]WSD32039.1 HypC/HybG/HupF family hydrogenase formation chaperone [Streptomyces sp. NBC_01750]
MTSTTPADCAEAGTYVSVHVGFAITTVDGAEAERTLGVLRAVADAVTGELGEPLPQAPLDRPDAP